MRQRLSSLVEQPRRWRRVLGTIVAALSVLAPAVSQAIPYSVSLTPNQPFQPLTGSDVSTLSVGDGIDEIVTLNLPAGFTFKYYENTYSTIYLHTNGLVTFNSSDATTLRVNSGYAFPSVSNTVKEIIGLWWSYATCPHPVKTKTVGTAPARQFVVEMRCHKWNGGTTLWELQLILSEGSSTFSVHYGNYPAPSEYPSVYAGIQNRTATEWTYPFPCGGSCTGAAWPNNTIVTYSQGPELTVASVSAPFEAFPGIPFPVTVDVLNSGGEPAVDFAVQLWVNEAPTMTGAIPLGGPSPIRQTATPGQVVTFEMQATIPLSLGKGEYFLLAEADPDHVVPVGNRAQTIGASASFPIGLLAANLRALDVVAPDEIQPGRSFDLSWTAANIGNAPAPRAAYQILLSASETPSASSRILSIQGPDGRLTDRGFVDLVTTAAPGVPDRLFEDVPLVDKVFLPADVPSGRYWIGVRMDPDQDVYEHDRSDNTGVSGPTIAKSTTSLAIATSSSLWTAEAGTFYSVVLKAIGGDGTYFWKLSPGSSLPPGLYLHETPEEAREAGFPFVTRLSGTPSVVGTFEFSLDVVSGSLTKSQRFTLSVVPQERVLTALSANLPDAYFGSPYTAHLVGGGGVPPYYWSLESGRLPGGIDLHVTGTLEGRPQQDGLFPITVRATDSRGVSTTRNLELIVQQPPNITCGTTAIGPFRIGEAVDVTLQAGGGTTKTWELHELWALPSSPLEPTKYLGKTAPEGLSLGTDGRVTGVPTKADLYDWLVAVKEASGSTNPTTCMIRVEIIRDRQLTITTGALLDAVVGHRYSAKLEATGGEGEVTWTVKATEPLPSGLSLSPDGVINGTPSGEELAGETVGSIAFTVRAVDENNRFGTAPLSITLHATPPGSGIADDETTTTTCQSAGADPSLLALATVLGVAALRRRRSA